MSEISFYDLVLEHTDIGICITDKNGLFLRANKKYCALYGYSESELKGKHFKIVVPEVLRHTVQFLYDSDIDPEQVPSEWVGQRKNGTLFDLKASFARIPIENGDEISITTVRDHTVSKKYRTILEEAERMAQLGIMASNSAHFFDQFKNTTPDVILMDITLKDSDDGVQIMEMLRCRKPPVNIPVIFITGNSDPENIDRAKKWDMLRTVSSRCQTKI